MKLIVQRSDGFIFWGKEGGLLPEEATNIWGPPDPTKIKAFFDGRSRIEHRRAQNLVDLLNTELEGEVDNDDRPVFCHRRYFDPSLISR